MLFNSYVFIFVFLPIILLIFFCLGAYSHRLAVASLLLASLFFYGWWNLVYVALLAASITFNYFIGVALIKENHRSGIFGKKSILAFGVAANLGLLAYYKYANFFLTNINTILGAHLGVADIILPLGISFFTFTQIAFLVDSYRGEVREYNFIHYCLFVTYFPHLIAGPVLHHKEIMPQFAEPSTFRPTYENMAIGLTIFSIGLFKKVVVADGIAPFVSPVFDAVAQGNTISSGDAWFGVLAYSFQLYFDFSGYSDMAIGISRMFGVNLPINFYSPYKAVNIIEFWRRWHITLSRFLRDYLYIPLGGNRRGSIRRYHNLFLTMLLGGLWHGAGWTYVIWGGLHGLYLVINHAWHGLRRHWGQDLTSNTLISRWIARLLTSVAIVVAWVFFRASGYTAAMSILGSMFGFNGFDASVFYATKTLQQMVLVPVLVDMGLYINPFHILIGLFVCLYIVVWFLPNTTQLTSDNITDVLPDRHEGLVMRASIPVTRVFVLAVMTGTFIFVSVLGLMSETPSEFLYFQF
jgi:alginate O-acetyltransferase complex protein AlgI